MNALSELLSTAVSASVAPSFEDRTFTLARRVRAYSDIAVSLRPEQASNSGILPEARRLLFRTATTEGKP